MKTIAGCMEGESPATECLRYVLEFSRTAVSLQDADLRYTWAMGDIPGFSGDTAPGKRDAEIFPPPVASCLTEMKGRALQTGLPARGEIELAAGDGAIFLDCSVEPFRDGSGGILSTLRDISEGKRAAQALREAQAAEMDARKEAEKHARKLEALLKSTNEGFLILDPAGKTLEMNAAALQLHGFSSLEEYRTHVESHPGLFDMFDETGKLLGEDERPFGLALRGETFSDREFRVIRKDTGKFWIAKYGASPVRSEEGEVLFVVVTMYDITETKEMISQFSTERSMLRAIFDHAPEGIVVADRHGRITMTNQAANRMYARSIPFGLSYASHAILHPCYPDGRPYTPRDLPLVRSALDGEVLHRVEMSVLWPDGQCRHLLVNSVPIRSMEDRPDGAVSIFQDITDQKELSKKVERLRKEHELFMMHEIKNLFIPLQVYTESLLLVEDYTPEQRRQIDKVRSGVEKGLYFAQYFQKLQSIEIGRPSLICNVISLKEVMRDLIWDLEDLAKSKGVTIALHNRATYLMISADVTLMPGVFRNLLLNAIEHVAERASDTEKVVTVEILNSESKIITAINNRGEPIHPNQLSTFFEKFNFASSRKKNGLGLGTNYAYLVVKAHQGDIHVRSTEQEGTTVTVTLDTVQANAGSVRHAS